MNAPFYRTALFLLRHAAGPRNWPPLLLLSWLRWHWARGHVGIIRNGSTILAVGVARCVNSVAEAQADPYACDEEGAILWVDELATHHPDGLSLLLTQAQQRFGTRTKLCGRVSKRPGELRMLPWSTVVKLTRRHVCTTRN